MPRHARGSAIFALHGIAGASIFGNLFPSPHLAEKHVPHGPAGAICDRTDPWHRAHAQRIFPSSCERWKASVEDVHSANRKHQLLRSGYRIPAASRSKKDPTPRETAISAEEPVKPVFGGSLEQDKVRGNKKAEDFSSAFPGRYLPSGTLPIQTYCIGCTVPSQVEIRLAGSKRITPSANEQK